MKKTKNDKIPYFNAPDMWEYKTVFYIQSSKPWYHRLYQVLSRPITWIFKGYVKYE